MLTAAALVVIVGGLRGAQGPVISLLIAGFLALLSYPLVAWLTLHRVPRLLAIVAVVLLDALVLFGVGILIAQVIGDLMDDPERLEKPIDELVMRADAWLLRFGIRIPDRAILDRIDGASIMSFATDTIGSVASMLTSGLLVVLTMIFFLAESASIPWKLRAASGNAKFHLGALARITGEVQRYLRLKTVLNLATGICMGIFLAILGVSYPVLWGVLVFFLNYVPSLGSMIVLLALSFMTLTEKGLATAVIAAVGSLVIHTIILGVIEPAWLGRRFGLSVLVVFLSLIAWGWILGPIGMLFAVPLTMVLKISLENSSHYRWLAIMLEPTPILPRPSARHER